MGQMMEMSKSDRVVCSVVVLLGSIAGILGFVAEGKNVRVLEAGSCSYPKSSGSALGITAAVALLLAQVIANFVAGCVCYTCGDRIAPRSNRTSAIVCLVLSWITFTLAFILLIGGAIVSRKQNEEVTSSENCKYVKSGVFASGATLALATIALTIGYYLKAYIVRNSSQSNPHNDNISMAQPQYGYPNVDARASKV